MCARTWFSLDKMGGASVGRKGNRTPAPYPPPPSDQSTISRYAYGYDDAGRRTWVLRANGRGDVYAYDATDQLTNVLYEALNPHNSPTGWTNEARYAFDPAGNRTRVTLTNSGTVNYTANALNQYTAVGDVTPNYDANGNLTWDGRWAYAYDRENRLVQAANDQMTLHYRYDAFNRLVERSVGSAVVRYYYDDRWRLVAEYDGAGNLLAKYVYGPEIDEPVRMTRGAAHYYYHAAALGTVTEITDVSGNLVERYTYDVYGEPTIYDAQSCILSISSVGNRLLFQGRDLDPDTGLYNFRNRYYTPRWGRFAQVDPIRHYGGINLYAFAKNNSINMSDPYGFRGYWSCVLKVLQCEAYSLACGAAVGVGIIACVAVLRGSRNLETFFGCLGCPGVAISTCREAGECWVEASNQDCVDINLDIPPEWPPTY